MNPGFNILNYCHENGAFIVILNVTAPFVGKKLPDIIITISNKTIELCGTLIEVDLSSENKVVNKLNSANVENLINELFIEYPEIIDIFRIRKIFIIQNSYSNLILDKFSDEYPDFITILDANPFRDLFCTESFNSDRFYKFQLLNSENGVIECYQKLNEVKFKFNKKIMFSIYENNCFEKVIVGLEIPPGHIYYTFDDGTDVQKLVRLFDGKVDYRLHPIKNHKGVNGYYWHLLGDFEYKYSYEGINEYYSLNLDKVDFRFVKPREFTSYKAHTDVMAIDLSTTRSVLTVSRNTDKTATISIDENGDGNLYMPSCIAFCEELPLVGDVALKKIKSHRDYVLFDTKYFTNEIKINHTNINMRYYPFAVVVDNTYQTFFVVKTTEGYRCFSSTDINEILLRTIKNRASQYQNDLNDGKHVTKAVITVPSTNFINFNIIKSITDAAERVGIEIIDIIEEGVADLLYYMSRDDYVPVIDGKIDVIDIGGGTGFADEYVEKGDKFCKKRTNDSPWKGVDIDRSIMNIIRDKLIAKHGIDPLLTAVNRSRLRKIAIQAKEALSTEISTRIDISDFDSTLDPLDLDRTEIEEMISFFEKMATAFYNPETVEAVYLAGGTSMTPLLQEFAKRIFREARFVFHREKYVTITSQGAMIRALQVLNGEDEPFINRLMSTRNPNSVCPPIN